MNITWLKQHSCIYSHYMRVETFMLYVSLYASTDIHGVLCISCSYLHSCVMVHYMLRQTFMG